MCEWAGGEPLPVAPARSPPSPPPPPCACALGSPCRGLGDSRRAPRCSRKPSPPARRGPQRGEGGREGRGEGREAEPRAAAAPRGGKAGWAPRWAPRRAPRRAPLRRCPQAGSNARPRGRRLPGAPARGTGALAQRQREREGPRKPQRCRGRGGAQPCPTLGPRPALTGRCHGQARSRSRTGLSVGAWPLPTAGLSVPPALRPERPQDSCRCPSGAGALRGALGIPGAIASQPE